MNGCWMSAHSSRLIEHVFVLEFHAHPSVIVQPISVDLFGTEIIPHVIPQRFFQKEVEENIHITPRFKVLPSATCGSFLTLEHIHPSALYTLPKKHNLA